LLRGFLKGQIIRRTAAAADIIGDVRTTSTRETARGGKWKDVAESRLQPCLMLYQLVERRLKEATETLEPLEAAIDAIDDRADPFIGKIADDIWNLIGRPAFDAGYSLVYPGGISYYTEGSDDEQPERMSLLAELLEAGIITKLDAEHAKRMAAEIRAVAKEYHAAVEAAAVPRARVKLLERVLTAAARAAHIELAKVKRVYKAEGFSEAEIHSVIPDRPRPSSPKPATGASSGTAPGTPPAPS
jgi:hypothetical protein